MNSDDSPISIPPPNSPLEANPELNAAELLARGLESAKAATGNPLAWHPPTPEELAALLPQYEIEALLGRGGMGAVYKGRQSALDRPVAIKLLPAELAADESFLVRFQREARMLAKLQHPGIVAVHDFGQTSQGHLYFVMEFVDGTDLSRLIHGPGINAAQALEIITQICDALQYAHGQGVIHRDIKPANVLINQQGRAKLADFGLARPTSEDMPGLTGSQVVMGTPDYMAPEQMAGNADHRADLYALGVMLYEMLTGQTPRGAWAPPSQRVQVDVRLDQVVVRALQQDPALRYQQASEIKTDVDVIRTTPLPVAGKAKVKPASAAPGQHTTPLPRAKKPGSKMAWAAMVVLPLLALAGWWVAQNHRSSSSPASDVPWQRVERTAEQWAKTGQILKDGWVHSPGKAFILFDRLSSARATSQFAVRAKVKFHEKEASITFGNTNGGGHRLRAAQFWAFKQGINNGDRSPAGTQRHAARVELDEEAQVEVLFAKDKAYMRFNHEPAMMGDLSPVIPWEQCFLLGGLGYSLRDIEYAILDGIPDPLKALGWEVPADEPSPIPWTRVERTAEEWAKTGQTLKDGWIHNPGKNVVVFDRLSAAKSTSQFAVRTKVKFHELDSNLSFANQTGSSRTLRQAHFYAHKQTINNGDHPPPVMQRHVSKAEFDEEAYVEVLVVGDKVYTRFNGQPVVTGDLSPIIPWEQCYLVGGLNHSLRDIEYAILDGIPDPLKALGWEVPEAAPAAVVAACPPKP